MIKTHLEFLLLPEKVRKYVLHKFHDFNTSHGWWTPIYDQFTVDMGARGITVLDMHFTGFWSQGDGACFRGEIEDFDKFVDTHKELLAFKKFIKQNDRVSSLGLSIKSSWNSSGNYCHEYTLKFEYDDSLKELDQADYDSLVRYHVDRVHLEELTERSNAFADAIKPIILNHCRDLYKRLEDEHTYQVTDEAIIEGLIANDFLEHAIEDGYQATGLKRDKVHAH